MQPSVTQHLSRHVADHTITLDMTGDSTWGIGKVLYAATLAALGAADGSSLKSLHLKLDSSCIMAPDFWAALPVHLPSLSHLTVSHWSRVPNISALAQLVETYTGPGLTITFQAMLRASRLRAELQLPEPAGPSCASDLCVKLPRA